MIPCSSDRCGEGDRASPHFPAVYPRGHRGLVQDIFVRTDNDQRGELGLSPLVSVISTLVSAPPNLHDY
ncbi:Uncharacterized protein HZ326_18775 [Fusarium oxysporum f. sp. albedinis]|nr:Uncharacterized protein HZ326_18775 [Fusarium oxysporum f. sp. albedinis]